MKEKLIKLFNSTRFWFLTFTAGIQIIKYYSALPDEVLSIFQAWLIAVVALGTADSLVEKASGMSQIIKTEQTTKQIVSDNQVNTVETTKRTVDPIKVEPVKTRII